MTADLFLHFLLQKELSVTQKRSCGESTMQEAITAMCNNKISLNNDVKLQVRFKSWQKLFDIFFAYNPKASSFSAFCAQVKFKF
jgi:threonine dehydrogenase-like Zn-dependent dehydrogenase